MCEHGGRREGEWSGVFVRTRCQQFLWERIYLVAQLLQTVGATEGCVCADRHTCRLTCTQLRNGPSGPTFVGESPTRGWMIFVDAGSRDGGPSRPRLPEYGANVHAGHAKYQSAVFSEKLDGISGCRGEGDPRKARITTVLQAREHGFD